MCFLSTWNGTKKTLNKQGNRGVSHGWIEITSELNVRAAELSLNFRIMRNYAHGNLCTWFRNSYKWEGWCRDELSVCHCVAITCQLSHRTDVVLLKKKNTKILELSPSIESVRRVLCFSNTSLSEGCEFSWFCEYTLFKRILRIIFRHSTKSIRLWNQFAIVANSIPTFHDAHWPRKTFS